MTTRMSTHMACMSTHKSTHIICYAWPSASVCHPACLSTPAHPPARPTARPLARTYACTLTHARLGRFTTTGLYFREFVDNRNNSNKDGFGLSWEEA